MNAQPRRTRRGPQPRPGREASAALRQLCVPESPGPVVGSLCTGYGGLDLGVLAALGGGRIAWCADPDPHIRQILDDPHFQAREVLADYPDQDMGRFPMHAIVPRLSGTPGGIRAPAPHLGQHNREVLGWIGVDDAGYAALLAEGVVAEGERDGTPAEE